MDASATTWKAGLSAREVEVCAFVAEGLSNKQIGEKLNISYRTVEFYRARGMEKLGVTNVVTLTRKVLGVD